MKEYLAPFSERNDSATFVLPASQQILKDFRLSGGSLSALLRTHIDDTAEHKGAAVAIIQKLKEDKQSWEEFERIRVAAEKVEALLAKDQLVELSREKGPAQIQALKEVKAFTKDHPIDEVNDPIDEHLADLAEEEP